MKVLGQVIATLFLLVFSGACLCFTQWLAWNGPQWVMMQHLQNWSNAPSEYVLHLSPLIGGPLIILSIVSGILMILVWTLDGNKK